MGRGIKWELGEVKIGRKRRVGIILKRGGRTRERVGGEGMREGREGGKSWVGGGFK